MDRAIVGPRGHQDLPGAVEREHIVAGFRLAYELVLGPQRAGGISHVFVQASTSVPKLPDGTTASVGPLQYLEPASGPQRFVVDFCKRKWCWGCGMGECQERH